MTTEKAAIVVAAGSGMDAACARRLAADGFEGRWFATSPDLKACVAVPSIMAPPMAPVCVAL